MRIIADLHIHSHFSRATSPRLTPPYLDRWARIKGIQLVGTGDCTHPLWLKELGEQFDDAGAGFYTIKKSAASAFDRGPALAEGLPLPGGENGGPPRFVLSGEISTIYKKNGKTRKVHHVVLLSGFGAASNFQARLERMGNIHSDGRPILGVDSRDLFAVLLDADPDALLIPAHIWTPWFSVLGARSGFDSIEECYGDLAPLIPAVETGLSSNPPMNWAVPELDRFSIISNSDAHSPDKLGREASIFDMDLSFAGLRDALSVENQRLRGTVEFFPQEGKYHYDGHRKCGVYMNDGTLVCPVCGKPFTRGVMGRVLELAGRPVDEKAVCPEPKPRANMGPYYSLIPLKEILGELLDTGPSSQKASALYGSLIEKAGSELGILIDKSIDELERIKGLSVPGELIAQALGRMRSGSVSIKPGYDGEYGVVRVFGGEEKTAGAALFSGGLFAVPEAEGNAAEGLYAADPAGGHTAGRAAEPGPAADGSAAAPGPAERMPDAGKGFSPDDAQKEIINAGVRRALVIAGPGTGKTAVLSARIIRLIDQGAAPDSIAALSFTVKAACELRERVEKGAGLSAGSGVFAATFHSLAASILRERAREAGLPAVFSVMGEEEREALLREICSNSGAKGAGAAASGRGRTKKPGPRKLGAYIESRKRYLLLPGETEPPFSGDCAFLAALARDFGLARPDGEMEILYARYREALRASEHLDYDDLISGLARLLAGRPDLRSCYQNKFRFIFVDEYQDINFAQYALIRLLVSGSENAGEQPSLWAIGDPNQAIYGFRGSDRRFIDRFSEDYPDAARFELLRSFRCPRPIIKAAGLLAGRELESAGDEKAVELVRSEYATDRAEAEDIARRIAGIIGGASFFAIDSGAAGSGEAAPADCAVLFRAAPLALPLVKALEDHGIPYEIKKPDQGGVEIPFTLPAGEGVKLMTIHASKGLEFDYVFVAGLEEGMIPFTLYDFETAAPQPVIEEERRLLYVAMTRARKALCLSWARTRNFRGRTVKSGPSRFLNELEKLIPIIKSGKAKRKDPQGELF